jgi:hypothetical protein
MSFLSRLLRPSPYVRAGEFLRRVFVLAWLMTGLAVPLHATSVVAPDFTHLVNDADFIVRARVKAVTSEWQVTPERRTIITKVELEVVEAIAGTPPSPLVLVLLGGKVGDRALNVHGSPHFEVGDEDILFVHGNGQVFVPLVAVMYGRFPVLKDPASGAAYVARSNRAPLHDVQEVSRPMGGPVAAAAAPAAAPLTPAEFALRIRAVRTASHNQQKQN